MNKLVKGNLVRGLPLKVFENNHTCVACKKGKQHRASCKSKPVSSVSQPRLHMDLFGPTFVKSLNKKSYCLVVTDDYSRFTLVFFLATKDETSPILKTFITGIENQLSLKVKIIKSDNETKFKNQDLNQLCGMKKIKREFSVPRTPQQNRIVERKNMTLIEAARTMLADLLLPIPYWAEAVNTACYRVLVTKPHNKTLYELLLGRTPSIGFMRPFGCPVTFLNTLNPLGSGPTWLFDIDTLTKSMNYQPVTAGNQPNPSACIQEYFDADKAGEENVLQYVLFLLWSSGFKDPQNSDDDTAFEVKEPEFEVKEPESEVHVSPSSSAKTKKHDDKTKREAKGKSPVESSTGFRNLSEEFKDFFDNNINEVNGASTTVHVVGKISTNNTNTFSAAGPSNTPATLEDITYSNDEKDVGAEADFSNLETSITVSPILTTRVHKDHPVTQIISDLSSTPQTRSMTRMVKDQGGLTQINNEDFHTCMFACFLSQEEPKREEGIDYEEVFAPVARIEAIRLFLAYASFMGFIEYQMDVKSAFFYGTIEEEVYVCQPPGFEDPDYPDKVYKVVKVLYGLHQDPRAWYETLANYLLENGFQRGMIDQTLFVKKQKGIQVKQKPDGIFISQDKYVAEILRKFGLTDGKLASTPIDIEKPLLKDPDGEDVNVHTYRSMICSLMYLTSSRPDIMFVVCACARFQVRPKASHLHAVKRIFRYLKGKPYLGLWYPKDLPFNLVAYSDSDYTVVATSSTEAEDVAVASCCAQVNDVMRLQALIDRKKVIITEDRVRQALRLDDAESIDCLPNEEIFTELARMGYEKPSTKLTFYKAFFLAQWKFLIHTILQCTSVKRTAWNEFSSSMASAVICLATGRKFNFLKYIFDSLVRNVDSSSKFYMYLRFLQLMIAAQVGDLTSHTTKYTFPALTQKVFANMRRVGKGFSGVDTPLFEGMLVQQQVADDIDDVVAANVLADDVADVVADDVIADVVAHVAAEPTPPSPTLTPPPPQQEEVAADVDAAKDAKVAEDADVQGRLEESQAQVYHIDLKYANKVLSIQDDEPEPAELKEVIEVVTTANIMTEVVTAAAATITPAPSVARRRKWVVIRDPEETATPSTIQAQIEQDEAYARELEAKLNKNINWDDMIEQMDFFKGMSYDDIRPIFEKYFNSNVAFLEKSEKELEEEASRALKRKTESSEEKAVKKQKLDEEVEELKKNLQIIPNDEDDVYTEATPLALKLFVSFLSLIRNFDREDLEMLWQVVQERFASSMPNNFSGDFLLGTLKVMFEKPDVEAQVWKNQRGIHGLAKVKTWRLLESCGVHIITFTTTQMILLVERLYPLTRFTLDQMLNNVRLEVEKESEVSLELLRFVRRQQQEGYRPDVGVDAAEDFKEYTLRDYYCWLKTYCCWYKLMLLDNATDSRLRLLEQSVAVDVKMKKYD
uniref:Integrase catalytic domain-containing protein n=1 Tax=Tanacetum cinerariifolium TaxID=118510 RepID=A0A699HMZ7_TANCI|nr:hypothetical protein [Tanacetum cinerariifolium]